ncbi:trigger factor [Sunxiuqinia elliptica]|uniref:Trigger factor n=1 Tax=Sunxiuqinia elliptica TaxID=655355 RepID=A0A4R6HAI1_9BACT|nr:trigger factor [Sunxiuqinia elliptica]TDO04938.1 trigger factor [Sunxiuqinia elliptica]TDO64486.1 trigger factor [Sunxiuqinia elliptica]
MNITKENINELNAIVTVKIEKSDYEATVNEQLREYRKKANMPGFRPGKVPAGLVKKMYGKAILAEEVNKMLSQNLTKFIVDEKLNILGEPLPNEEKTPEFDWEKTEDFEFAFDVAVAPEIEVKFDKRKKYPYYLIQVDDEMIDQQVESYTGRFGENETVDAVEEKDTIRGNFVQLDAEGNELEEGIKAEQVIIAVDLMKDEEVKKAIQGKKAGDTIVFDPVKVYENKHEVGHMLNISHEEAENIEGDFKFTISEVLRFKKAEVNEELFKKAFGEDTEIKTEEEFRNKLRADIEEQLKYSSDYKFTIDSRDILVEKISMELPEEFLKRWLKETNNELTEEQIEADFDNFMKDLRWQLIKDRVAKDNEVKIEQEDVKAMAKEIAAMQFRQYGMFSMPDEQLSAYADQILQNEEERRRITTRVQEEKIMAIIKENVNIDEKAISQEDFNKLLEK